MENENEKIEKVQNHSKDTKKEKSPSSIFPILIIGITIIIGIVVMINTLKTHHIL